MITTDVTEEDLPLEGSLRPQTLDEYIGQEKTKKTLKISYTCDILEKSPASNISKFSPYNKIKFVSSAFAIKSAECVVAIKFNCGNFPFKNPNILPLFFTDKNSSTSSITIVPLDFVSEKYNISIKMRINA